ncbi:MAG: TerB family tellurite resistance protein [Bacteroidia bacterium]|nr:TerB family tellurite resistance protein [Bacteroidia bacterium]
MVIHNSFNDFVLFLYVHMAHSDGESHDLEKGVILEKMSKLYPPESDYDKIFEDAVKAYDRVDKSKVTDLMRETFKHFDHVKFAQKYKIYTDMYDIINADGIVHTLETRALKELKQIIDIGTEKR